MSDSKAARRALIGLAGFLGVTAFLGGIALLLGYTPPPEMLAGSPFSSYVLPGLALMILIGGGSLWATWALARRQPWGPMAALVEGVMILVFEMVEFFVVGFTWLLALYVAVGISICVLAAGLSRSRP